MCELKGRKVCKNPFCKEFFPEWQNEGTWTLFWIKGVIIFLLVAAMLGMESMTNEIFNSSRITYGSMVAVACFNIGTAFLLLVYLPYQHRVFPLWFKIVSSALYFGTLVWLFVEFLIGNGIRGFETDTIAFDIWTVNHTLAGVLFAWMLPFWWMTLVVSVWEVLEAEWTVGLGDGEDPWNHVVDVIVALVGWWIFILIWSRDDIPWVSARRACHNNCKRTNYFQKYFLDFRSEAEKQAQASQTNSGSTHSVEVEI